MTYTPKGATPATAAANEAAVARYDMDDRQDFTDRDRGFIAPLPDKLYATDGRVIFDAARYDYLADDAPAPDTVHPSLWRQSQLIRKGGLYKVVDGVYQVRNNDIANLTVIEGDTGLVVVDCMASVEAASQGMGMIREHVSDKPVAAVIYTHTHIDHYGGVKGVVSAEDVASGKVPIIAPGTISSFDKHAIGENVIMRQRHVPAGLLRVQQPSRPRSGRLRHLRHRDRHRARRDDLVHLADRRHHRDGCEAGSRRSRVRVPVRPRHGGARGDAHLDPSARCADLRGECEPLTAQHPDAARRADPRRPQLRPLSRRDAGALGRRRAGALRPAHLAGVGERAGDGVPGVAARHVQVPPRPGTAAGQQGLHPLEAAEEIELPEELGRKWFNRGYHGTLHHDVRAVFTKELGMWDGDPVSLHPHPPVEAARRFVDLIGAEKIMDEGRRALADADYRWAAQILHTLVFAQPENQAARDLQADAYEQMGYQAEGPQWRGIFLTAAMELRQGIQLLPHSPPPVRTPSWPCPSTSSSTSPPYI